MRIIITRCKNLKSGKIRVLSIFDDLSFDDFEMISKETKINLKLLCDSLEKDLKDNKP